MEKRFFIFIIAVLIAGNVSASFTLSNSSIDSEYAPEEKIRGWINLSLEQQDANSLLQAFDESIELIHFLENNSLILGNEFSCHPADCHTDYDDFNREETKTYSLNSGDEKLLGLKIDGEIESIDGFSIKIKSDSGESGYPQLFIDILNDNSIEWQPNEFSGNFGGKLYGCYEEEKAVEVAEITSIEYCEKIEVPLCPKLKLGAFVNEIPGRGGEAEFTLRAYKNDLEDASCTASASGSQEISCEVNMPIKQAGDFFVCISTRSSIDNNKYSVYYEQNAPCGFSGEGDYEYDFPIFAEPGRYSPIGEMLITEQDFQEFSETEVKSYILSYIDERYNNNCEQGCIIPIRIVSGIKQTLNLSEVQVGYTAGISRTERFFNDLAEKPAEVNMEFRILDLEKSDISVPSSYGTSVLSLRLGGEEILKKNIEVLRVGRIEEVFPLEAAAAVPVKFTVSASGNISEYGWDFGDGNKLITEENFVYHTYQEIGIYDLRITVTNSEGKASKSFSVDVKSPKEQIEETLSSKKDSLENIKSELSTVEEWVKLEIEKEVNVEEIENQLNNLQKSYDNAQSEEDYVNIMTSIYELKIPEEIQKIKFSGDFLPFPEEINPYYLTEFGYEEDNPEEYSERIVIWMANNLDLQLEGTIFNLKYPQETENLITYYKLKIRPLEVIEEAYLILEEEATFKEDYRQAEVVGAKGIKLSKLEETTTIEFMIPGKVEAAELSLYISPDFSELPGESIGLCDNDGICETEKGENEDNCINDCHKTNWGRIMLWMGILLFCAFLIYIILQEWYKRHYERRLFKNKDELYNLMSFIYNALRQGKRKRLIYAKLKEYNWKTEQIVYAFKKLLGKRTGMWEIPVFRIFEKRRIQKELSKRKNQKFERLQKI